MHLPTATRSCCICSCHHHQHDTQQSSPSSPQKQSLSITPPRQWFKRIRRRSSVVENKCHHAHKKKELIDEYQRLYTVAVEEASYAMESQGSIYYEGDLVAAKQALSAWMDHYHTLSRLLNPSELVALDCEWDCARKQLQEKLELLPEP